MLYNIKEIAREIRMSEQWVWNKINKNKIKTIRMGGKIFISEEELKRIKQEGVEK